jgi:hypothetical protein
MTTLSEKIQKARKEHICDICGEKIMPGEKYMKYAAIGGNRFFAVKIHLPCWEVGQYLDDDLHERLPFVRVTEVAVDRYETETGINADWKTAFQYFYERAVKNG